MGIEKFKAWCYKVMPLVYEDSLSYYEFLCKMLGKLNEVIDLSNTTAEQVSEMIEALRVEIVTFITDNTTELENAISENRTLFTNEVANIFNYNEDVVKGYSSFRIASVSGSFNGFADGDNIRESLFEIPSNYKAYGITEMHSKHVRSTNNTIIKGSVSEIGIYNINLITRDTIGVGWINGVLYYCDDDNMYITGNANSKVSIKLYSGRIKAGNYMYIFSPTTNVQGITAYLRVTNSNGVRYLTVPVGGLLEAFITEDSDVYAYFEVASGSVLENVKVGCSLVNRVYNSDALSLVPTKVFIPSLPDDYGYSIDDRYNGVFNGNNIYYRLVRERNYQSGDELNNTFVTDGVKTYFPVNMTVEKITLNFPTYFKNASGLFLYVKHRGDLTINYIAFA